MFLLLQIEAELEYPHNMNNCVSPINQLLIFLRFCATGTHLMAISDFAGTHTSTASRIVARVSRVIASLYGRYIHFPDTPQSILEQKYDFYNVARFPKVIGVIDYTYSNSVTGGEDAEDFRNRMSYFSFNVSSIGDTSV